MFLDPLDAPYELTWLKKLGGELYVNTAYNKQFYVFEKDGLVTACSKDAWYVTNDLNTPFEYWTKLSYLPQSKLRAIIALQVLRAIDHTTLPQAIVDEENEERVKNGKRPFVRDRLSAEPFDLNWLETLGGVRSGECVTFSTTVVDETCAGGPFKFRVLCTEGSWLVTDGKGEPYEYADLPYVPKTKMEALSLLRCLRVLKTST